jgi:hypothetical protein
VRPLGFLAVVEEITLKYDPASDTTTALLK